MMTCMLIYCIFTLPNLCVIILFSVYYLFINYYCFFLSTHKSIHQRFITFSGEIKKLLSGSSRLIIVRNLVVRQFFFLHIIYYNNIKNM